MKRSCIAIDRQFGSGGREVGKILSEKLQIPFYDGELLLLAADRFGLNPGILKDKDEKRTGSVLHDIAMFAGCIQDSSRMLEPYQMFEAVRETICRLAVKEPAIFIGRCADVVLKDVCSSLNIFIYASDMEERISRVPHTERTSARNLEYYIKKKDQQRREYYKMFAEKEWGQMENYDICLNTSSLGYEGCADVIVSMAERPGSGWKRNLD